MANFETVLSHRDPSIVRVIVTALRAHGFSPRDDGTDGLPGMPGVEFGNGFAVQVPSEEAADAKLLADALLQEMLQQ